MALKIHQSEVIGIADNHILQNRKSSCHNSTKNYVQFLFVYYINDLFGNIYILNVSLENSPSQQGK